MGAMWEGKNHKTRQGSGEPGLFNYKNQMSPKRDKWFCCGHLRRTAFCADCGATRPVPSTKSDAEILADEFAAESHKCLRTADTFDNQAESISIANKLEDKCDDYRTFGELVHVKKQSAIAWRKRGHKFARWERIVRDLIGAQPQNETKKET